MKMKSIAILCLLVIAPCASASVVGLWEFDDSADTTAATIGNDLSLVGSDTAMVGYDAQDGAVSIDVGSHYVADHGISPAAGEGYVNEWSLLIDFKYPALDWISLYQTNSSNTNDGDCFVRNGAATLGVSASGYSTNTTSTDTWYRMVVTADNDQFYRIFVDGQLWLDSSGQGQDGRFSLDPVLLLFADENGEDNEIHVSTAAIWDSALTADAVADMGAVGNAVPEPMTLSLLAIGGLAVIRRRK
ncbi:hypothetical protein STSP2_01039 [Anaerohalosphaera lusitana]|uniref:PEP-CTERM protein-sorting domain-containing protein n=1 Tax=Anaerohalosphaera lusitana TaxID=1936003 RepID=A0A1U9NJA6_9BACT|nr:PEP-CTERM sorting domain-containing protein [Anaerohalosphaera lusitana]AQT67887.1 hypothetical protein STSP2_01039 [Anaerohalosphaera lusitana]